MGSIARAAIPFTVGCGGHFVHRHMDAERGRRLADDAAYYVPFYGGAGAGGNHVTSVSGNSSGGRVGRHGGSPAAAADYTGMDGGSGRIAGSIHAARLCHSVDSTGVYFRTGDWLGDE